jgi:hypothetical protein
MSILRRIADSAPHPLGLHLTRFPEPERDSGELIQGVRELEDDILKKLLAAVPPRRSYFEVNRFLL